MIRMNVGRNDPCPCGSGRKHKKCCLNRDRDRDSNEGEPLPSGAQSDVTAFLQKEMEGQKFESHEELRAFMDATMQRRNQAPQECFDGLSADIMHCLLHKPFDSPQFVTFPEQVDSEPDTPLLTLFKLLVEAIGVKGLKATANGNLPRKFCRDAATVYWDEENYFLNTKFSDIYKEDDFWDLHIARVIFELAGLLRKNKGKFILSRKCRDLLNQSGLRAIHPCLLRTYARGYNWAFGDRYPELVIVQQSFLFSLYLLQRHGDHEKRNDFYSDAFLKAFPMVLDEMDKRPELSPYDNLEREVCACYTWRTLRYFVKFLGLASVESTDPQSPFCSDYKVKKLPLLDEMVLFHV